MAASKSPAIMSDAEKVAAFDALQAQSTGAKNPPRYKVVVSDPNARDRTLFSSVSEKRAREYVEKNCPRGSHFFVLSPDGSMHSYEHERHSGGPQGEDIEAWQPFDRDAYSSPELQPSSVNDPWADAWEGAQ